MESSQQELQQQALTPDLPLFDILQIDSELSKPENKGVFEVNKSKFSFHSSYNPQDKPETQPSDNPFPKYFSSIDHKLFKYTGVLSNQLKRDIYGYSFFENRDEFLGEYNMEKRNGFGIYKYREMKDNEKNDYIPAEIYIGEYKDNSKNGNGIYLSISKKSSIKDKNKEQLIIYDCAIGVFKDDLFQEGKIFSIKDEKQNLFVGKIDQMGIPNDDNGIVIEDKGDRFFFGRVAEGKMKEGRNIFLDEKGNKTKGYYFTKKDQEEVEENRFDFSYEKGQEKDEEIIKKVKQIKIGEYRNIIQGIFEKVCQAFNTFKTFEKAKEIDFENNVKKNILDDVNKLLSN